MQVLLNGLFNRDVRSVRKAIDALSAELDALEGPARVCDPTAFDAAKEIASSSPSQCRDLLDQFGRRDVATCLVHHAAGDLVATGSYHTYRGMLGIHGTELKRLHDWCVNQLAESGSLTIEQRDSAFKTLADDIKRAG